MKLNVGCGSDVREGYVNIDLNSKDSRVVLGDVSDLSEYEDESVDEVLALDIVEHFPLKEVEGVLGEWCRVLKRGGVLRLMTPDVDVVMQMFYKKAGSGEISWRRLSEIVYGNQKNDFQFHKVIFSFAWLEEILKGFNMREVRFIKRSNQNMVIEAVK